MYRKKSLMSLGMGLYKGMSMVKTPYPRLVIDLGKLKHNVETVKNHCKAQGIALAAVIKGCNGLVPCAKVYEEAGVDFIASSRIEQIARIKKSGVNTPLQLIRIPMLSEVSGVVRYCDISLNSDVSVLKALNKEAIAQGKVHKVILMADCGDLREGFWDKEKMLEAALMVENECHGLQLAGTGFNIGCYGSIMATPEKLQELVDVTEHIEDVLGRRLDYISGGASTSYFRVLDGTMPKRINMLRIGEVMLVPAFMFGELGTKEKLQEMFTDVFTLQAEVIELEDKPTHPIGEIGFDAFGHRIQYEDRGIRKKALLAIGKCDYGDWQELIIKEPGMKVLGASSDHTIIDVQDAADAGRNLKVGDIVEFNLNYATIVYVTNSENVTIEYI